MTTKHNHAPNFGRRVANCPRCIELDAGAAPILWHSAQRAIDEARQIRAIRAHDCKRAGCGPVCTAFDW